MEAGNDRNRETGKGKAILQKIIGGIAMSTETALKQTPLFETYGKYGAKVIDFGGWALPVQFSSILDEHEAVRTKAGLFDVSHMGEVLVEGKDAESYINYLSQTM